jgi:hypothetical protein
LKISFVPFAAPLHNLASFSRRLSFIVSQRLINYTSTRPLSS